MNKILVFGVLGLVLIAGVMGICNLFQEEDTKEVYQGPVPEGYDLEHFRQTGETIKEVDNG